MKDSLLTQDDVSQVRDEIVKKINSLVGSKSISGGKRSHENKSIINNLRHQISKLSSEDEKEED